MWISEFLKLEIKFENWNFETKKNIFEGLSFEN